MRFLALDLGSTFTKAALMEDSTMLRQLSLPTPPPCRTEGGRYEIDAAVYFAQMQSMLEQLREPAVSALLLSTQMHGCVLTDHEFQPLSPYLSWQDGLGAARLPAIRSLLSEDAVAPSGVPLKGNLALCALLARRLLGEKLPLHARLCTLGGYMIGRLTGEYVCHMTNAAPTGLADVRGGCWNTALLDKAGLNLQLPRLVTALEPVGAWKGIAVYPDLGDQQVCAAGAGLSPEGSLHISLGTAGLIGSLTSQWASGAYENRPWLIPGVYLRTISGLPGGREMAGLAKLLLGFAQKLGSGASEAQVWAFLASCFPHAAPPEHPWQRLACSPEEWVVCLYHDFAAAYAQAAAQLELPIRKVAFSGGCAARNPALRSALCRTFACDDPCIDFHAMRGLATIVTSFLA